MRSRCARPAPEDFRLLRQSTAGCCVIYHHTAYRRRQKPPPESSVSYNSSFPLLRFPVVSIPVFWGKGYYYSEYWDVFQLCISTKKAHQNSLFVQSCGFKNGMTTQAPAAGARIGIVSLFFVEICLSAFSPLKSSPNRSLCIPSGKTLHRPSSTRIHNPARNGKSSFRCLHSHL